MIHELIEPKKKTNKTTSSRNSKTFQDKPFSDHFTFDLSDCENKEAESSSTTTFIPPWLRNSLGLNQRNNHSHAAVGHSDQKAPKIIQRYKGSIQNEFEPLKTNADAISCKKVADQSETLLSCCPQEENAPASTDEKDFPNHGDRPVPAHWNVRPKESNTDSSCVVNAAETKFYEKEDSKVTNADPALTAGTGKLSDEEKKKTKFVRQRTRVRRRVLTEQKALEPRKADSLLSEVRERETLPRHAVSAELKELEAKLRLLIGKAQEAESPVLTTQEGRLLQDVKEQVGNMGNSEQLLEQVKELNVKEIIKKSDFLTENIGDKKMQGKEEKSGRGTTQNYPEDSRYNGDKDSELSTDDENDIKRFSEFLSKNRNAEEKRKCLEEVRNYFERKRRTRLSKRRYLEQIKSKLTTESERKEEREKKDKVKSKELFTIMTNRGKKSKFAFCEEEVMEKAVDETLQKFVELYHFHVSPKVMGNMKKNILQAMQSDSMESSRSKVNMVEVDDKPDDEKVPKSNVPNRELQETTAHNFLVNQQVVNQEVPNIDAYVPKELKKKTFKTLLISSGELPQKHFKETDVVENERLKRLNKEFENFLHSVHNQIEVSNLKIQSIVLEKEQCEGHSKNVPLIYNFTNKVLETDKMGHWQAVKRTQEPDFFKDIGVQVSIRKELAKKSVRIQVMEHNRFSDQGLQTDDKTCSTQFTQTECGSALYREFKELKSFDISPGLYRMVKSREVGKFYLYPEQLDTTKDNSNSSLLRDRKCGKKSELLSTTSKETRIHFREKERGKLRKTKKHVYAMAHLKDITGKRERRGGISGIGRSGFGRGARRGFGAGGGGGEGGGKAKVGAGTNAEGGTAKGAGAGAAVREVSGGEREIVKNGDSVDCLYFRNLEVRKSESVHSRKEARSRNASETKGNLELGDAKGEDHWGCTWLWNGKKISPGCDLKTHVEDLLKEKLKEMSDFSHPNRMKSLVSDSNMAENNGRTMTEDKESQKNLRKNASAAFSLRSFCNIEKANRGAFTDEVGTPEATDKTERKKVEECQLSVSQEKMVRNVATQNSQQTILSLNLTNTRMQSKASVTSTKKKRNKPFTATKPVARKFLNFRNAEEIIRAVEEIKYLQLELKTSRKDQLRQSDSLLGVTPSSSSSRNDLNDPLSLVLGVRDVHRSEQLPTFDHKRRSKKLTGFADHEVQTDHPYDPEASVSEDSRATATLMENHKHLELIENVLCRVSQKERESLWNDIREFIKNKLGRDINDDGAREVCIEIEQDMPKHEQGLVRQTVMAKGHYMKNEGDVEVEIDLTLDDLEKILRQRQRRIRRQHLYRRSNKRFISSSSFQSYLTRDEVQGCQKHLNKFITPGGEFLTEDHSTSLKKNKGN